VSQKAAALSTSERTALEHLLSSVASGVWL
jgi:hypothetical protein